ncbi:hypothetical protein [Lutibacter sp. HS1-25]|uniref:hypothetical protein n=1 Tax=Lutibacter sp. HS1-25 TaxID=2485000 RepID=UPI0010111A55|nr:hypothetical protein [Lutibacter sp. HS1-25]
MKTIYPFLFLILLFTFSCNRANRTQANEQTIDSLSLSSIRISNKLGEMLIPEANDELSNWKEYKDVDDFILTYYNISIFEALNNASELESLVKLMKDSIRIASLNQPSVIVRFNVLHNETLRLEDMATIPSISDEAVSKEVTQILALYSAVNSKINTVYRAKNLQDLLEVDTETPLELAEEPQDEFEVKKFKPMVK